MDSKTLENQLFYPIHGGESIDFGCAELTHKWVSVLRSPLRLRVAASAKQGGAGVNEEPESRWAGINSAELDEVKINEFLYMIHDTH